MPYIHGAVTKTKILKSESHKLFCEFEVGALTATITFDADLVTSNTVDGQINGVAITQVTFSVDHDTTMDLLVAELLLNADIATATLTDASTNRQITVTPPAETDPLVLSNWVVAAGATQANVAVATDTNNVYKGQLVQLAADGTIEPVINGDYRSISMGIAMHDGVGAELVTVMMKAFAVVFMEAATALLVCGPVTIHANGYNTTTGYLEVDDASVTYANMVGWALDIGGDGDVIRVAVSQ